MSRQLLSICAALMLLGGALRAQPPQPAERTDMNQAKLIRVRRMSQAWQGEPVELRMSSGLAQRGRFLGMDDGQFQLRSSRELKRVPIMEVREVVLRRKPQDLLMVGLTAAGISALFAGGARLGFEADARQTPALAGVGAVIGFAVGWKAFYQDIVIRLE